MTTTSSKFSIAKNLWGFFYAYISAETNALNGISFYGIFNTIAISSQTTSKRGGHGCKSKHIKLNYIQHESATSIKISCMHAMCRDYYHYYYHCSIFDEINCKSYFFLVWKRRLHVVKASIAFIVRCLNCVHPKPHIRPSFLFLTRRNKI